LTIAACGGGSSTTSSTSSTKSASSSSTGSSSTKASTTAFAACLKKHGVSLNFPTGGRPASGGTPPFRRGGTGFTGPAGGGSKFAQAAKDCASVRPKGSSFGGPGAFNSSSFTAYRNCLKLHGVSVTAGSTGASGPTGGFRSNPRFKAAQTACAALQPGSSTGATGSS